MNEREFLRDVFSRGDDCLSAADLESLAREGGSEAARLHSAGCAHCASEVAFLRSFEEAQPSESEAAALRDVQRSLERNPRWKPAAPGTSASWLNSIWPRLALGGLAAALAVGVFLQRPGTQTDSPSASGVTRSARIEIVTPLGDLSEPAATLRWQPVEGAIRYSVRLQEVDETTIWDQDVAAAELALPESVRSLMTDRKTLFWVIRAEDSQGRVLATSPARQFRVIRSVK